MIPALHFARRELRAGLRGFRILVAGLALGVAAIASVQSLKLAIETGLQRDARVILGGDVAVRVPGTPATARQLSEMARYAERLTHFVELRAMARGPDAGGASLLVELKGVDEAYPLYGALELAASSALGRVVERSAGAWGAAVEPTVLERLGLRTGDRLRVGAVDYEIRDIISHEPDRLGVEGAFGLAPRVMVSRESLAGSPLLAPGSLARYQYRLRLPAEVVGRTAVAALRDAFPEANWRMRDYTDPSHRTEHAISSLDTFLTLVALAALLIGGLGAGNAVSLYLRDRTPTIATLKCIGASHRVVFTTYLAQVLAIAAIGIALGVAMGAAVVPLAAPVLAGSQLPIEAGVFPGALLRAASFGLLVVVLFALVPLDALRHVSPGVLVRSFSGPVTARPSAPGILAALVAAAALALLASELAGGNRLGPWFVLGALATMALLALASRAAMRLARWIPRARHPAVRLAMSNLHRPGAATTSVVLALGTGITVLVTLVQVETNLEREVRESLPERIPDLVLADVQASQIDGVQALVRDSAPGASSERVPYLRGRLVGVKGTTPELAFSGGDRRWLLRGDLAVSYASDPPVGARLLAGDWWPAGYGGPTLVSVSDDVARAFDLSIGDTVTTAVLGRELQARVANVRASTRSVSHFNFPVLFSPQPMSRAPHSYVVTVSVPEGAETSLLHRISTTYSNVSAVRVREVLEVLSGIIQRVAAAFRGATALTLAAGMLVVSGAVIAAHAQRRYDNTVLKVLGATRADLAASYLIEYGLLGLGTGTFAAVLGSAAAFLIHRQFLETGWKLAGIPTAVTIAACTALTLALGCASLWRALSQRSADCLRNE